MYQFFGWLNIALLAVVVAPYVVRVLNTHLFHAKGKGFTRLMKVLRIAHKPAAAALIVSMLIHGWLALGGLMLHTGTILAASMLATAAFGLAFYLTKKRRRGLLMAHKGFALFTVLMVLVHLFIPDLFSYF